MTDATTPATESADAPPSFDKGVEDIAALLADQDEPDLPEDEAQPGPDTGEEAGPDGTAEEAADDAPEEVAAGGKFVSRDAKVRLDDGTVISVGDLARNNLFQRDYTRKTEELKAERETIKAEKSQYSELAQALAAQRDFLLSVAPKLLPQAPDRNLMQTDPIGYMQAKAEYDERVAFINQIYHQEQAEKSRRGEETAAEKTARERDEAQKLLAAIPEFKDRRVYETFLTDANEVMTNEYGFSQEDLKQALSDHRYYKAMRDLVLLAKARKKGPQVAKDVQTKPKLLKPGAQMNPKAKISRDVQAKKAELRKTGDFDVGISLIESLI